MYKNKRVTIVTIVLLVVVITVNILFNKTTNQTYGLNLNKQEYGTYEDAQKIIKEVMKAYYIRGPYMQYNYAKTIYGGIPPELATSQDTLNSVCAAYNYDVYNEAFGMTHSVDNFPRYNYEVMEEGANYYSQNKDNSEALNGNFLIYYEKKSSSIKYVYGNSDSISDFAQVIQPGDIFVYTGHVMVAYDKVEREPGVWDVLMLESGGGGTVPTRIESTSKIYYHLFASSYGINNNLDIEREGNIKTFWLSNRTSFGKNGILSCAQTECAVIRAFYNDNGKAMFNYGIKDNNYQKSTLRTNYPGLFIEKTVSASDKNSVYFDDELTYTIKITNKSGLDYNPVTYNKFYIDETIDNKVEYISSTNNGVFNNSTIKWTIDKLDPNESIELKYTVRVKNDIQNINTIITPSGNFYAATDGASIGTGIVENKIVPKLTKTTKKRTYNECYTLGVSNNKTALELIDYVYSCVYGKDFHFDEFNFENMFTKKTIYANGTTNAIRIKNSNDDNVINFKKMILNNYWSGLVKLVKANAPVVDDADDTDEDEQTNDPPTPNNISYMLPSWHEGDKRAKEIKAQDFKDGDVLIYYIDYDNFNNQNEGTKESLRHTKEKGIYTYVYVNGEFVGNNYPDETENLARIRNKFDYQYYYDIKEIPGTNVTITKDLYSRVADLTDDIKADALKFANYQTLYDKDYYVILRPELAIKEIYKIEVTTLPTKKTYKKNVDNLNLTGGVLTITYNDGTTGNLNLNNENINITGYNNSKLGTNTINVIYEGENTTFDVTIVEAYNISYYQGNGTVTAGNTKFSHSTACTYNTSCKVANYQELTNNAFPLNNNGWSFAGYSTSSTGITRDYTANESFTYNMNSDLELYAVGVRNFRFSSGIAPTTNSGNIPQYWNPYKIGTNYVTSISIPTATTINGWTFIGYRANNTASSTVTFTQASTYKPTAESLTSLDFRAIYQRNISIIFDANGGSGTTVQVTKPQYYNSGFGNGTKNSGANISNVSFTLPANNFTKEGYIFKGWGETPDTTNFNLAESNYTNFNPQIDSEIITKTLYAIWEKATITPTQEEEYPDPTQEVEYTNPIQSNHKTSTAKILIPIIILITGLIIGGLVYILRGKLTSKKEENTTPEINSDNTNNYTSSTSENNDINNNSNKL